MKDELIELVKKHIKHSLCTTPKSIQARVYLDGEEISSLRSELPQCKELSDEFIEDAIKEWFDLHPQTPSSEMVAMNILSMKLFTKQIIKASRGEE